MPHLGAYVGGGGIDCRCLDFAWAVELLEVDLADAAVILDRADATLSLPEAVAPEGTAGAGNVGLLSLEPWGGEGDIATRAGDGDVVCMRETPRTRGVSSRGVSSLMSSILALKGLSPESISRFILRSKPIQWTRAATSGITIRDRMRPETSAV